MTTAMIVPPVTPNGVSLSHVWPGRLTYTSPDGFVRVVMDTEAFDFHVDAHPAASVGAIKTCLAKLDAMGLEPLDEEESPAEALADGFTRIYFVPSEPVSAMDIGFISIPDDACVPPRLEEPEPCTVTSLQSKSQDKGDGLGPIKRLTVLVFVATALVPKQHLAVLAGVA